MSTGLLIMGIHHPEKPGENKFIELQKDAKTLLGDKLKASYVLSSGEKERITEREKLYIRAMRSLGAYALKRIDPGMGSSIHYAGTLPFTSENSGVGIQKNGKLNNSKNIYVADGSGFLYLPAKGLTFSLMANAHNVARNVLKNE
jgi:hypothetical protein